MILVTRLFPIVTIWLAMVVAPAQRMIPAKTLPIKLELVTGPGSHSEKSECFNPCPVTARVSIDVHPNLRKAVITFLIDGIYVTSSEIQLDEYMSKSYERNFTLSESGTYDVVATLYDSVREVGRSRARINVEGNNLKYHKKGN